MSEYFSVGLVNQWTNRMVVPETVHQTAERVLVRRAAVNFLVRAGLAANNHRDMFWYADIQPPTDWLKHHPSSGFNSGLCYDALDAANELVAQGIRLTHEGQEVNLIPPKDPQARLLDLPVVRLLMVSDTTADLRYMPGGRGGQPFVIPAALDGE
ncbi:MAG TPA: hypothetical protein VLF91_02200 [Candidatus Saccharimonadales bacterium]|nr:hypothetical protein [Candidatus Saccharimonadales bacterium]